MVPFAGYELPVQYPDGVLKSHLHTCVVSANHRHGEGGRNGGRDTLADSLACLPRNLLAKRAAVVQGGNLGVYSVSSHIRAAVLC